MAGKILVTYATRSGSTAGVAETIAKTLTQSGYAVDLRPMQVVGDLSAYDAVVAGSAIQNRQWLPEAVQFLQTNRMALRQTPFAMFAVCMTLAMPNGEKYRSSVAEWLSPLRNLVPPASEGLFAGSLDIRKIPSRSDRVKFRLSVLFGVWSQGDHRDWDAVRAWAAALPQKLGLEI